MDKNEPTYDVNYGSSRFDSYPTGIPPNYDTNYDSRYGSSTYDSYPTGIPPK